MADDLLKRFTHHPPKDDFQAEQHARIRRWGYEFAQVIVEHSPTSREQSLALTKVEEAVMWANAAIAHNE